MANQYETVFIMTPVLSDDQMKETVAKYQKLLNDKGAEIVFENNWGLEKTGVSDPEKVHRVLLPHRVQSREVISSRP